MSFLIDTDICSAHLKQSPAVTNRFLQYTGRLHISVVTVGELMTWALRAAAPPHRLQGIQNLLRDVLVLEIDQGIAEQFGRLRAGLLDIGRPIPEMDLWIAATAITRRLAVVTHNTKDVAQIPRLTVFDWLTP